jgi:hypothetical protein
LFEERRLVVNFKISIRQVTCGALIGVILLCLCFSVSAQGGLNITNTGEMLAYTCTFNGGTELAEIHASVTGPEGLPINPQLYTVNIVNALGETLPQDLSAITTINQRPRINLILILDTTSTVPVNEVRNAIREHLLPRLLPEDQMALLQVDTVVAPMTQFYTDKNALYNEHIAPIQLRQGDNRIYDAILQAVNNTQPNSPVRQVLLVITDSRRGASAQAATGDIVTRAQASRAQVFTIGYVTADDNPDQEELFTIADETRGRSWVYTGERTRAAAEQAIGTALESFSTALNSEVLIQVNIEGQTPDETGQVPLTVSLVPTAGGTALTDTTSCPTTGPIPPELQGVNAPPTFTIAFANIVPNLVVNDLLNIEVSAQPEEVPLDLRFVFWLDDEMNDQFPDGIYILDTPNLSPGSHTLRAQLRDAADEVVASTPTVTFYVQRELQLSLAGDTASNLTGPVTFNIAGANGLPSVDLVAVSVTNPAITQPLVTGTTVGADGTAAVSVEDIQQLARQMFPTQETWELQVVARAPAASGTESLGVSNTLPISVAPIPQATFFLPTPILAPLGLSLVLLVVNFVLWRQVGNARVRRLIEQTDNQELGQELMSVTVNRAGVKQTYMLTKKTMYVGRGSGNDIGLEDDSNVSRQHGVFMWRGGQWWFANRKPKVKTKIDGKMHRGYALRKLKPMTEIQIGDFQLVYHSNAQGDMSDLIKTNL